MAIDRFTENMRSTKHHSYMSNHFTYEKSTIFCLNCEQNEYVHCVLPTDANRRQHRTANARRLQPNLYTDCLPASKMTSPNKYIHDLLMPFSICSLFGCELYSPSSHRMQTIYTMCILVCRGFRCCCFNSYIGNKYECLMATKVADEGVVHFDQWRHELIFASFWNAIHRF